jgi:hypothetical protein
MLTEGVDGVDGVEGVEGVIPASSASVLTPTDTIERPISKTIEVKTNLTVSLCEKLYLLR